MRNPGRLSLLSAFVAAAVASGQGYREQVRVGLVSVRVDAVQDGRPVTDLKAPDLKIRVDGREIAIEGLDAVAGRATPAPEAAASTEAPAVSAGKQGPAEPASDLYLAILVDETATNAFDRRDVVRQIESFVKSAKGAHVMLARFDGRLHVECPWTTDPRAALAGLSKIQKHTFDARLPSPAALRDGIRNPGDVKEVLARIDYGGRRSFEAIMQMLLQFPEVTDRRALAFVSDGTALIPPMDLAQILGDSEARSRDAQALGSKAFRAEDGLAASGIETFLQEQSLSTFIDSSRTDTGWTRRMAQITNKALELDIAFYPIDSESVGRGVNPGVSSRWPNRPMPGVVSNRGVPYGTSGMTARVPVTQSMGLLADATGGQAILVPHQTADRLGKVVAARDSGYLLTFRDPFPNDFRFHRLEIRANRPGIKLLHRRGYRVRSDDERTMDTVVANLEEPTGGNPFDLRLSFDTLGKESGRNIVEVRMQYAPRESAGSEELEREIQIWAVCSDDDGNRGTAIVRRSTARRADSSRAFSDAMQLGIPPGQYTWSIAIKDVPTGVVSYAVLRKQL